MSELVRCLELKSEGQMQTKLANNMDHLPSLLTGADAFGFSADGVAV